MPYGTLPVLEVDGVMLNQTTAIMRFFGEEYGYVVDEMQLEADLETVVDDIKDVQISNCFFAYFSLLNRIRYFLKRV